MKTPADQVRRAGSERPETEADQAFDFLKIEGLQFNAAFLLKPLLNVKHSL
jgi:hypothetical protein